MLPRFPVRPGNSIDALIEIERTAVTGETGFVPMDLDGCVIEFSVKPLLNEEELANVPAVLTARSGEEITHLTTPGKARLHLSQSRLAAINPDSLYSYQVTVTDAGGYRYTPDGLFGRVTVLPSHFS